MLLNNSCYKGLFSHFINVIKIFTVLFFKQAKKNYEELEKLALAAREQAADAEDKYCMLLLSRNLDKLNRNFIH